MKKLILMLVATCAIFAQGAALLWTSDTARLMDSDNINKVGEYAGGGQIVLALLGSDTTTFSDAQILQSATLGSGKSLGKVYNTYTFTYDSGRGAGEIMNGDILAVLYQGSDSSLQKLAIAGSEDGLYTPYTVSGIGDNSWSSEYKFASGNFQEPSSIPEPTSGLLLIVGGALLSLRRKVK